MMRFNRTQPSDPPGSDTSQHAVAATRSAPGVLKVLLDQREVTMATTLSRTALYEAMKDGFPAPVKLSRTGRRVAWRASEVLAWCESRAKANEPMAGAAA